MTARTGQSPPHGLALVFAGGLAAAALGSGCGAAMKPTAAESGLPRPPQLLYLSKVELALLDTSPDIAWPSVPRAWRT